MKLPARQMATRVPWEPVLASVLAVAACALLLGGLGRFAFSMSTPEGWTAVQGGALVGLGIVAGAWAGWLVGRWKS